MHPQALSLPSLVITSVAYAMNHQSTVLVLNRNWQAIHVKTPAEAFAMMATGAAQGLDIAPDGSSNPVTWAQWLALPLREHDNAVGTVRGKIRQPTVLVLTRYGRVPKKRPGFNLRGIWERDGGQCQYTGRRLKPSEGNIDHVLPRSRGGATNWENCVLADKAINSKKANRLPQEAGLKLLRAPVQPRELPVTQLIRNALRIRDWEWFLPS
jgi:5-methylcytosine-specific restriction endonuclease McrA